MLNESLGSVYVSNFGLRALPTRSTELDRAVPVGTVIIIFGPGAPSLCKFPFDTERVPLRASAALLSACGKHARIEAPVGVDGPAEPLSWTNQRGVPVPLPPHNVLWSRCVRLIHIHCFNQSRQRCWVQLSPALNWNVRVCVCKSVRVRGYVIKVIILGLGSRSFFIWCWKKSTRNSGKLPALLDWNNAFKPEQLVQISAVSAD